MKKACVPLHLMQIWQMKIKNDKLYLLYNLGIVVDMPSVIEVQKDIWSQFVACTSSN